MSYGGELFNRPPRIFAINPFADELEGVRFVYVFAQGVAPAIYRHPLDSLPPGAAYKVRFKLKCRAG